ncbi:MAG: type II toxin-antitoxin system VapC family toxin [Deltaproteobacteria bacterium]|nr:type II toxin-antitoxin system VapC family toxin [Deltaproteobacteria bacterium]
MGVILDTSVLIEAERGRLDLEAFIKDREQEPFGLSVIAAAELIHGVYRADSAARRRKRSAWVEKVLEVFPLFSFTLDAARIYADIWAQLRTRGATIGAHDLIIGSTALALGFSVATFNKRHFDRIEGLTLEMLNAGP